MQNASKSLCIWSEKSESLAKILFCFCLAHNSKPVIWIYKRCIHVELNIVVLLLC